MGSLKLERFFLKKNTKRYGMKNNADECNPAAILSYESYQKVLSFQRVVTAHSGVYSSVLRIVTSNTTFFIKKKIQHGGEKKSWLLWAFLFKLFSIKGIAWYHSSSTPCFLWASLTTPAMSAPLYRGQWFIKDINLPYIWLAQFVFHILNLLSVPLNLPWPYCFRVV